MLLLYHAYVYLEFLILACTIYILAPVKLAGNVNGITVTGTVSEPIYHLSNAKRNQKYIQNHELINFDRLVLKGKVSLK